MRIQNIPNMDKVFIAAHRGDRGMFPENTMPAFESAIALGADMIETDLRRTRDGQIVLIHDETVDRTTNGFGPVSGMNLEELRRLDADKADGRGMRVPTFAEFLDLTGPVESLLFNIEFKEYDTALCDEALRMLRERGMLGRCVFTCFNARITSYLNRAHGVLTQGFPGQKMKEFIEGPGGSHADLWAVGIVMSLLTPQIVREFTAMDIQPWCYTPNDDQSVRYALDCGARLMTCDDIRPALRALGRL